MEELMPVLTQILGAIPEFMSAIVVLATILVRMTPSKKDDEAVSKLGVRVWKVIQWLPTIGVNPQTKALEAAYKEAKAKLEALEADKKPPSNA